MADDAISKEDFDDLAKDIKEFRGEFDLVMNGDKNTDNGGRRGMVSNIRELRGSPSLLWLLKNKTIPTVSSIYAGHLLLNKLTEYGNNAVIAILKFFNL